jgi:tRNA(Ile)-lysidine synthase
VKDILEQVEQTIIQHHLIKQGDSVLIALSGGPDSVGLLNLLLSLRETYSIKLAAAHLDHALRANSSRDRQFCQVLCNKLNIKFHSKRLEITSLAKRMRLSFEEAGRLARYEYFQLLSAKFGYSKIATGHTLDDNVETVLLNLVRGTGLHGLSGIPIQRDNIIRPLLNVEKQEILAYLKSLKLPYKKDPTNRSTKFSRNRIRSKIIPELQKLNPSAKSNIARMAANVAEELEFIGDQVQSACEITLVKAGKNKIVLDLRKLRGYDKSLKKKVVEDSFRKLSEAPERLSSDALSRILKVIDGKSGAKTSLDRIFFLENSQDRIAISRSMARPLTGKAVLNDENIKLEIPGITELRTQDIHLESKILEKGSIKSLKGDNKIAYLDNAKMKNVSLRFWRKGDRIRPFGMVGHKLLSDIFIDRRIPEFDRQTVPLILSDRKIAWIPGVMISEDFKVDENTKKVLEIRLCAR